METMDTVLKTIAGGGRDLRIAAAFLTRLPVGVRGGGVLAGAAWAFPVVGAGVGGAAAAGLGLAFWLGLPPLACAMAGLAVAALLTGGLHEDGLADTFDGLGGGRTRDDRLRIMRDSRIGTYGVLAVVFSVGLRAAALSGMATPGAAALALIAAGAVSRSLVVAVMAVIAPARGDGLAVAAGRPGPAGTIGALAIGAVLVALAAGLGTALGALAAGAAAAAVVAGLARSRLGGHTGDVLGAVQQVAEIAVLAVLAGALG